MQCFSFFPDCALFTTEDVDQGICYFTVLKEGRQALEERHISKPKVVRYLGVDTKAVKSKPPS